MKIMLQFVRKYPFSALCFATIWVLSLVPFFPETPFDDVKFADKWAHIVMYGGSCCVLWLEYIRSHRQPDYKKLGCWAWVAPIVMGGVLELLQAYCTTTRNGDWIDLAANATGVTLAAVLGLAFYAIRGKR